MRKIRLSRKKQDKLVEHCVAGTTAWCECQNRNVRLSPASWADRSSSGAGHEVWVREIEVDESYFGGRQKGERGRGAAGKVLVFGVLERGGKGYTQVIPDAKSKTVMPFIERKVIPDSIVYCDCWRGYNVLDVSDFKHYRINHSKLFSHRHNHINEIENFWKQAKCHMRKLNGILKAHFGLFLKECEWRFNTPDTQSQLAYIKQLVRSNFI